MKKFVVTLLLIIASAVSNATDLACQSIELEEHRGLADIIFVGKLAEYKTNEGYLLVNVLRKWKGTETGNIKLTSSKRWPINLAGDKYYLFYLNTTEKGMFWAHPCKSRIREVEFAGKDLILLGNPTWSSGND